MQRNKSDSLRTTLPPDSLATLKSVSRVLVILIYRVCYITTEQLWILMVFVLEFLLDLAKIINFYL